MLRLEGSPAYDGGDAGAVTGFFHQIVTMQCETVNGSSDVVNGQGKSKQVVSLP